MKKATGLLVMLMMIAAISKIQAQTEKVQAGDDIILTTAEQMPQFPGGEDALNKYITENIKYTDEARKNKEEGTVYMEFVVDATGKVINPQIKKGVTEALNRQATSVVANMPNWIPGKQGGKAVSVQMMLPVQFKL